MFSAWLKRLISNALGRSTLLQTLNTGRVELSFKNRATARRLHACSPKGSCTMMQIRLQKHDGNEQQRKSAGLNMTETWLDVSVPETWQNHADLNFHVSRRKYNGAMELHVSATFQKYGNMRFRPVRSSSNFYSPGECTWAYIPYQQLCVSHAERTDLGLGGLNTLNNTYANSFTQLLERNYKVQYRWNQ